MLELGGDLDEETIIARVKHRFITAKGLPPFVAALSQCMWAREHTELLARRERKEKSAVGVRREKGRDWERLIYPPIPPTCLRMTARGDLEHAKWREPVEVDSGQVVDTSLLGEWSPQFNALVDLYGVHLDDFARWRRASADGGIAVGGGLVGVYQKSEASLWRRDAPPQKRLSKRIATVSNLLPFGGDGDHAGGSGGGGSGGGGGARPLSKKMDHAFLGWTSHGQAYFKQMLAHLRASQTDCWSRMAPVLGGPAPHWLSRPR